MESSRLTSLVIYLELHFFSFFFFFFFLFISSYIFCGFLYCSGFLCFFFFPGILSTSLVSAEALSFTSYQPAYLGRQARGNNLLIGANFASASSGYFDETANLFVNRIATKLIKLSNSYIYLLNFS